MTTPCLPSSSGRPWPLDPVTRRGSNPTRAVAIVLVCLVAFSAPHTALAQVSDTTARNEFQELVARLRFEANERDSLGKLADAAIGDDRQVRNEQVWERQLYIEELLLQVAGHVRRLDSQGQDVTEARRTLDEMVRAGWPRYQSMLRRSVAELDSLRRARGAATGIERLAVEARLSDLSDRQATHLRALVSTILALERAEVDVSEPRRFVVTQLTSVADLLVTRMRVLERERVAAAAQIARAPGEEDLRHELAAIDESRNRVGGNLAVAIELMDRFGLETAPLKVGLITSTGKITSDVFNFKVLGGLLQYGRREALDIIATRAPRWLFRALVVVLIVAGFRLLASVTRRVVRRAVERSGFSYLLQETVVSWSGHAVMGIGLIVALTQLGVQVGAVVAGLGVAGFVIGFAMQNTLSNFAAGGMILVERPYDLGDDIEAGGASGKVQAMSLVATTILTSDNQTLIVPNSKIWNDVIRNTTAQRTRRVDMTFSVGYVDDLDQAERILLDILARNDKVLKEPIPVVKLHQLADGGVIFVVRPWAMRDDYWDVHWSITRDVKRRFDQEGISIPAARRDLYVHTVAPSTATKLPETAGAAKLLGPQAAIVTTPVDGERS